MDEISATLIYSTFHFFGCSINKGSEQIETVLAKWYDDGVQESD